MTHYYRSRKSILVALITTNVKFLSNLEKNNFQFLCTYRWICRWVAVEEFLQLSHRPLHSTTASLLHHTAKEEGVALHWPALGPIENTLHGKGGEGRSGINDDYHFTHTIESSSIYEEILHILENCEAQSRYSWQNCTGFQMTLFWCSWEWNFLRGGKGGRGVFSKKFPYIYVCLILLCIEPVRWTAPLGQYAIVKDMASQTGSINRK